MSCSTSIANRRKSEETFDDSTANCIALRTSSHAVALVSPGSSGPTHVTPGTSSAAAAAPGPPTAIHDATGTTPAREASCALSADVSDFRIPPLPSVATRNCATETRDVLAPNAFGLVHARAASSSSSSSSSRRRHRTSLLMRFRSSTTPRARPRSVGVVATGDVPAFSAASSDVTFTTRRSRRSSPGRTPCRTRAIPSVDAASAPCSRPNAGGDVTIAIIAARRTTATAGSRGRAPRLSRSNIIGDPPP